MHPEDTERRQQDRLAFVGALAGGLAHEIKNPLSTLMINLELLAEEWASAEAPREKRTLNKVRMLKKEVQRLEDIVAEFLRYARGGDLQLAPTDLSAVLSELLDFIRPEMRQATIELREFVDEGVTATRADAAKLKQAMLNLLINARQATAPGGSVLLRLAREAQSAVIEVTDTGCGIPAERLPLVWQPYYSTKRGGTGLGLAMTRRIIEEHGGSIEIESEVDRGTRVRVSLPLGGTS